MARIEACGDELAFNMDGVFRRTVHGMWELKLGQELGAVQPVDHRHMRGPHDFLQELDRADGGIVVAVNLRVSRFATYRWASLGHGRTIGGPWVFGHRLPPMWVTIGKTSDVPTVNL
jgi:hypothetical protein